ADGVVVRRRTYESDRFWPKERVRQPAGGKSRSGSHRLIQGSCPRGFKRRIRPAILAQGTVIHRSRERTSVEFSACDFAGVLKCGTSLSARKCCCAARYRGPVR